MTWCFDQYTKNWCSVASWVVDIYTWSIIWKKIDLKWPQRPPPFQLLFWRNLNFPNFWGIQSQISYPIAEKFSTFCSKSLKRLNKQWSRVVRIALELAIKNSVNACRSRNICAYRMVKKLWLKTRTMDARWGNHLHCTTENQLPLPNL